MKNLLILIVLMFGFYELAQAKDFSLGVVFGTPTGISAKYDLKKDRSIELGLSSPYTSLDYMLMDKRNFNIKNFSWSYGGGIIVGRQVGVRGVSAAEYDINTTPFHVFGNISFNLLEKTELAAALGVRYKF